MKRKFLALFLVCTLLLSSFAALTAVAETGTDTVATDGTASYTLSEVVARLADESFNTAALTLTLTADITVTDWTSVATFKGTLDGNGHKISGLNAPLFVKLDGATVKNLTVEGNLTHAETGTGDSSIAMLANTSAGKITLTGVTVNGSLSVYTSTAKNIYAGAFIGTAQGALLLTNCTSNAALTVAKNAEKECAANNFQVGGLIGLAKNDIQATGCVNTGALYVHTTKTNLVGGVIGQHSTAGTERTVSFLKCANYGSITLPNGAGGSKAAGIISNTGATTVAYSFTNCVNAGRISALNMAAGICADSRGGTTLEHCYNLGEISTTANSGNSFAAGILAQIYANASVALPVIRGCVNMAAIHADGTSGTGHAAGIIDIVTLNFAAFENNYNEGEITCTAGYAAGFIAKLQPNDGNCATAIKGCINYSKVTGKTAANLIANLNKAGTLTVTDTDTWNSCKKAVVTGSNGSAAILMLNGEARTAGELYDAIKNSKADLVKCTAIHGLGLQSTAVNTATGTLDIRFLAGLNVLEGYGRAGFELIRMEANGAPSATVSKDSNVVYTSVIGYDQDGNEIVYQASELTVAESDKPWTYLSAITVKGVPATGTVTFMVRPYLLSTDGSTTSYGMPFCVTIVNGQASAS